MYGKARSLRFGFSYALQMILFIRGHTFIEMTRDIPGLHIDITQACHLALPIYLPAGAAFVTFSVLAFDELLPY